MAFIIPSFGAGFIYGSFILDGTKTYVGESVIQQPFNALLQFFSQSNVFVGEIRLDHDNSNYLLLKIKEDKIGGLKGFSFEIDKSPSFSFFNLMKVKIIIGGNHWYTGELLVSDQEDTDSAIKNFSGRGYVKYLDDIDNITVTYENKTLLEILQDQLENNIINNTPIEYDPDLLNLPDITITKMEFNSKSVKKIFDEILEIANKDYDSKQYTYGVNKDLFFYFQEINNNIKDGFFEGFQFQDPKIKISDNKIINQIEIYRAKENGSDQLELVSTIQDTESQARYGLRKSKITVNEYIDNITALNIANAKLNRFKNPFTQAEISDIELDDKLEIGFYNLSSKIKEYKKLVNDCEDLSLWNINTLLSNLALDSNDYISGKNSFIWSSSGNSLGDNIELVLNEPIMYPSTLRVYFKQNIIGTVLNLNAFDEDGNEISAGDEMFYNILTEDGGFILTESGDFIIQEDSDQLGIDIKTIEDWYLFEFNISSITNLKKINYFVITNESFVINIDRIEVVSNSYFTRKLTLDQAEYELNRTSIKFNGIFGETIETIIDDIKKVEEEDKNIMGLFQK